MYGYILIMFTYSIPYLVSLFMFLVIVWRQEGKIGFVILIAYFVQTIVFN